MAQAPLSDGNEAELSVPQLILALVLPRDLDPLIGKPKIFFIEKQRVRGTADYMRCSLIEDSSILQVKNFLATVQVSQ